MEESSMGSRTRFSDPYIMSARLRIAHESNMHMQLASLLEVKR